MHKIPVLPSLIVFVLAFFVCSFFINGKDTMEKNSFDLNIFNAGRVLGAEEMITNSPLDISSLGLENKLPVSKIIEKEKPVVPKLIDESQEFSLEDCSGIVVDRESETVLFDKEADKIVPIASITKLLTALVFLDNNPGWETEYVVKGEDRVEGGKIYLNKGEVVTVKDLFYLSLIGSANTATKALARSTNLSIEDFVKKMNEKAESLELTKTKIVDPIGFSSFNVSTAREVAKLASTALDLSAISEAVNNYKYYFNTKAGVSKIVYNTNKLLNKDIELGYKNIGGKTGFTEAAGYCFAGIFNDDNDHELISVVLGGQNINSRFIYSKNLAKWAYNNHVW